MADYQNVDEKCDFLELGGEGPKALVRLLAARPSWREDKLEQAYYKETNPTFRSGRSNFRHLIVELLEHGLIKETSKKAGFRFQLNDTVWSQDAKLFEALNVLVHFYHENPQEKLRTDANLNTFLKRVTGRLDGTRYSELGWAATYPIAGFIASKLRDFSKDKSLRRFAFAKRSPDRIRAAATVKEGATKKAELDLFSQRRSSSAPQKFQAQQAAQEAQTPQPLAPALPEDEATSIIPAPQTGPADETPPGLPEGTMRILHPETFWPTVENILKSSMLRPAIFADRNALIVEMHVTAARTQRVMIGIVKKAAKTHFVIFSLCGAIEEGIDPVAVYESAGLDPSGVHPHALVIDGERFIGVVSYLPLAKDAPFYETISEAGMLADRLEAEFWQVDVY
ncbi:hypothetical protein [Magnetospira sp. QH-2]|uniref:hypothetical protein n=1 Tax=Magnetospira sp. (strain QH-2) TaxID=1288970 RepID=UPI0003E80C93|nr:hypothetical protein [Magnetospira sp. QH-2]CCQ74222.1 Protein of unknown function [Magnetospira sp. QH-2]